MKRGDKWRAEWRWPWEDEAPRTPRQIFAGLERLKARQLRGMVWKWHEWAGDSVSFEVRRTRTS